MMIHLGWKLALGCAALVSASAAWADTAINYNVVVRNNFTSNGSDTQGRVAAGGNISVSGYDIALLDPQSAGNFAAVAGGSMTVGGGGGTVHGSVLATSFTGSITYTNGGAPITYVGPPVTASPIDIAAEMTRLGNLSTQLEADPTQFGGTLGTSLFQYSQYFLTGLSTSLNVFEIDGTKLASYSGMVITAPTSSVIVLNISGGAGGSISIGNAGIAGTSFNSLVYNLYEATALSMAGSYGSVLAPKAALSTGGGVFQGHVFADSYNGQSQINLANLKPLSGGSVNLFSLGGAVPEPASWAMMVGGFGLVGGMIRRTRRVGTRAAA